METTGALARQVVDAWNRGDVDAVLGLVSPEVELVTPGGIDRGLDGAQRWVEKQTQTHAVMHIVVEEVEGAGDSVAVLGRRQMRGSARLRLAGRPCVLAVGV